MTLLSICYMLQQCQGKLIHLLFGLVSIVHVPGLIPSVFGDLTGARIVMPWTTTLLHLIIFVSENLKRYSFGVNDLKSGNRGKQRQEDEPAIHRMNIP